MTPGNSLDYERVPTRERWLVRWEMTRALGFWRFVVVDGVMAYGMTMAMALLLLREWTVGPTSAYVVTRMAVEGVLGGLVFGVLAWVATERKYARAMRRAGEEVRPV